MNETLNLMFGPRALGLISMLAISALALAGTLGRQQVRAEQLDPAETVQTPVCSDGSDAKSNSCQARHTSGPAGMSGLWGVADFAGQR